jgi:cytochrome c biogenesis protein CcdA
MLPGYAAYFIEKHYSYTRASMMALAAAAGVLAVYSSCALIILVFSQVVADTAMPILPLLGTLLTIFMGVAMVRFVCFVELSLV